MFICILNNTELRKYDQVCTKTVKHDHLYCTIEDTARIRRIKPVFKIIPMKMLFMPDSQCIMYQYLGLTICSQTKEQIRWLSVFGKEIQRSSLGAC